ncbi:MAG: PAS domain-containing protein, partial [Anaerolineales bacterium]|nr:PAS domain-containing protein [Anaerolineales bacterium]
PNWLEVQKDFQLRQLHFHLGPGSTSFLRVHRPDKFGDNMDDVRFTIVDTNARQSSRTGFETGRVYSGLRAVVPVSAWDSDEGKTVHVGALEVGASFDVILKIIDEQYDLGSGVFLTMDHVTSTMWPDFVKQRFNNGMDQCDCVIEASSRDGIVDIVHQVQGDGVHARKIGTEMVRVEDTFYAVSHFPLRDYLGDKDPTRDAVGAVLFWRNADAQMAAFNRSQLFNIIYGVLSFLFIEVLLFFSFRYAMHQLEKEVTQRTTELSESEARLSDAQRIAHLGNWDWNIVDNELWWSDEIYRIFDVHPNAFKATYDAFIEIIHPDDRALVIQAIEAALQDNKPYNIEHRITLSDGSERVVHEQAEVILDKSRTPVRMMGTILDITERKKVEQKLDESRNQLSLALEGANLGLWDWSPLKNVLHTNEIFLTMLGYSPNDFPETTERWSSLVHPDDLALSLETLQPYIDGDDGFYRAEFRMCTADNQWKSILDVGQVMSRNADGKADRFMGVHIDITDRVHAEEALKKSKQKLETLVSELSASKINIERQASELAALAKQEAVLNDQLKHEVEIKDKFFSIIAHDLRSPFNVLLGMTDMMVNMSDSSSKEELVESAMDTNIAAKQVFELLQNLLVWSLVQMEGKTPEQKMVSLWDLAQKSIAVLKPVALQKEIAL